MAPKWPDELNLKFVELYKEQRCLWDQLDDLYKDKNARETALTAIVENMNIQGFGLAEVKAKIKAFRGTFNIEYSKQQKSVKSGCGSADIYVPTLKWFNAMKEVMVKGTLTRNTTSTLMSDQSNVSSACKKNPDDENSISKEPAPSCALESDKPFVTLDPTDNSDSGVFHETSVENPPKKKFKPRSIIQQIASAARDLKSLSESVSRMSGGNDNEWDIFGRHVAAQMKLLTPFQALTAQMEINNTLTKCRFNDLYQTNGSTDNLLTEATSISNPSSCSSAIYVSTPVTEEDVSQDIKPRLHDRVNEA